MKALHERNRSVQIFPRGVSHSLATSSVLFLLGQHWGSRGSKGEPCIILNKRSETVRQPGDLCFPGGRVAPKRDYYFSKLLGLPCFPLYGWPHWAQWKRTRHREAKRLALLLAASLRESLEEMRLNPLGVKFLGPLPSECLWMFRRMIYPMVGWIFHQRRFFPNWEVERIEYIPLRELLNPKHYACYRLRMGSHQQGDDPQNFPCFLHGTHSEREILWGATYRMIMAFLKIVFGFRAPEMHGLPVVYGSLDNQYLGGPS